VVKIGDETSSGSCRSIPEFNIISALNSYQATRGTLLQYGGHAQAAGFSIPTKYLSELSAHMSAVSEQQLAGVDLRPRIDIEAEAKLTELGGDTFTLMEKLAPFGQGNPLPVFLTRGVQVMECRTMGAGAEHVRLKLRQSGVLWDAVGFGLGRYLSEIRSSLDVVYQVEADRWNGADRLRLNLLDFGSA
jgi:single-stranded-DNA-specific exonuclease